MKVNEILKEIASAGATSSGSVAVVSQPIGGVITRSETPKTTKYANSITTSKKRMKKLSRF